jgi:D-alanyl-D-alanine carboxypeptidase
VALAVAALLLAAAACSSDTRDAAPGTTAAPAPSAPAATSAPLTTPAPTTTAPPATTAPPTTSAAAGSARRALLSRILETHRTAGDFVGARIALRDRDGSVTEVTSGTQSVDPGSAPVDPAVSWNMGSATKTFVAVVVLQLAEEGRIDLDAGIAPYFPDLAGADRITPRQLLQHTSGLNEYGDQPQVLSDPKRKWAPAELIAVAEAAGRIGEPGGPHHYSNTNYIILGELIEKVTGHPWDEEVRSRIAEPLGMTSTRLISDDRPVGYKVIDGKFVDTTLSADPSIGGAAGALESTDHDLLLLAKALADGTLLSPASQRAMETFVPAEDYSQFGIDHGYGLGLERYIGAGFTIIGHMGTGEAQSAYVGFDREHGTAIAVMTNTATSGPQAMMAVEALTAVGQDG